MKPEEKLKALGLKLPPTPRPSGIYKPAMIQRDLVYVSGHPPVRQDGTWVLGRVGEDLTIEQGQAAARQAGLAILATLRASLESLDHVSRLVKVLGMVNSTPDFSDHPQVINGCSELFIEVFGQERGMAARSAVGMGSLPRNIAVEIEAIFEMRS